METVTTYDLSGLGWVLALVLGGVLYHFSIRMKMEELRREVNEANRGINSYMDENIGSLNRRIYDIEKGMDKSDSSSKSYYNSGV